MSSNVWQCLVDPVQFETAILNLLINARDAMKNGGSLTISVNNTSITESSEAIKAGDYVEILIQDTGKGMDRDQLSQAFEPFFTTKEVGKGTGLGLSMVFGFLRQSNGSIELSSEIGEGTRVKGSIYCYWRTMMICGS
ncbi:MAG: signal transduction histidine kinase [Granulosicoccus sp.]